MINEREEERKKGMNERAYNNIYQDKHENNRPKLLKKNLSFVGFLKYDCLRLFKLLIFALHQRHAACSWLAAHSYCHRKSTLLWFMV